MHITRPHTPTSFIPIRLHLSSRPTPNHTEGDARPPARITQSLYILILVFRWFHSSPLDHPRVPSFRHEYRYDSC